MPQRFGIHTAISGQRVEYIGNGQYLISVTPYAAGFYSFSVGIVADLGEVIYMGGDQDVPAMDILVPAFDVFVPAGAIYPPFCQV